MSFFKGWHVILLVCFTLSLTSCSGEDDEDGTIGTGMLPLEGTVATGFAVSSAIVTLKDSEGYKETTTTGIDGSYQFENIQGMTPPFLLRVTLENGASLYSVTEIPGRAPRVFSFVFVFVFVLTSTRAH